MSEYSEQMAYPDMDPTSVKSKPTRILVISHKNCTDGLVAAWVARLKHPSCEVVFAAYGDEPPYEKMDLDTDVFILDFSYPRDQLERVKCFCRELRVLDHHKTAQAALAGLDYCTFDMERSGCGLAWDHFFPSQTRPWVVNYAEDYDLWRHKLEDSAKINAVLHTLTKGEAGILEVEQISNWPKELIAARGGVMLDQFDRFIKDFANMARDVVFDGHTVACVNVPGVFASELGNRLSVGRPFSITWHETKDGEYKYSLRSQKDGGADVSEIAKKFGGGGHRNAAGFLSKVKLV